MEINWITEILIPILSAAVGGALTLIGVVIGLKNEKNQRKKDEDKKYKPVVISYRGGIDNDDYVIFSKDFEEVGKVKFKETKLVNKCYKIENFKIRNTEFVSFFFEGLVFNGDQIMYRNANLYIEIDKKIEFQLKPVFLFSKIETIGVLIKDLIGNEYVLDLGFEEIDESGTKNIRITGSKKMTPFVKNRKDNDNRNTI